MVRIQPALLRRRIEAAKEALPIARLAEDFVKERGGRLTEHGDELRGTCPVCGHGSRSQAFSASVEKGLWTCFACGEGGDQVRLAELVLSMPCAIAVGWLEHRYDLELPKRPDSWFEKQSRQERVRRKIFEEREMVLRRRLFRLFIAPLLAATGATDEEARTAWEDFKKLSVAELLPEVRDG